MRLKFTKLSHTYLYFAKTAVILWAVIDIPDTFQAISDYVNTSTVAFNCLSGLVGSIWGFVMVAKKLTAVFLKKTLFVDFCRTRASYA